MATEGAGSARIILVRRERDAAGVAPAAVPEVAPERVAAEPREVEPREPREVEPRVSRELVRAPFTSFEPRERAARAPRGVAPRPRKRRESPMRDRAAVAASGWTVRRLANAAALGLLATIAGGLVFQKNFQLFGDNNRQLLAMGFGLFVVGMVVLTLCLIGLARAAIIALIAGQGMPAAVILTLAPAVPLVLLNQLGLISYAFPAMFVIIVAGGFTLALKR